MLSNKEIEKIYSKVYNVESRKYVPLPVNDKNWKWENKDFPRVISLLEFKEFMSGRSFNKVLSFSGATDPEYEYLTFNKRVNYNYPEYDLHGFKLPEDDYDFIMLNQMLEHLYDPIVALEGIYEHMKPGGMFFANVPVNNIPHDTPYHYYTGFTAVGLGIIATIAGFDVIKIGQWGNKKYFKQMFDNRWSDYTYSDEPGLCDPDCPLIAWIFAVK
jgi:SAM-dependent methyltransferase